MGVEIINLIQLAHQEKRRKVVFNTPRCHAWVLTTLTPARRTTCIAITRTKHFTSLQVNARCTSLMAAKP